MDELNFKIKKEYKIHITLRIIFFIILIICLFNYKNVNKPFYIILLPLSIVMSIFLKIYNPLRVIGEIQFKQSQIIVKENNIETEINYNELSRINLKIQGEHMELRKDLVLPTNSFFPFELGHENTIEFIFKDQSGLKTYIFIENKEQTRILTELIAELKL